MDLTNSLRQLDIDIFRELNRAGSNDLLDLFMVLITIAGLSYVIVLLCIPLWIKRRRELAFDVVVLVILATLIAEVMKTLVDRPRPMDELEDVRTIVSASGSSFPSAHAARALAIAAIVSFGQSRTVLVSAFSIGALIAISRIYLGVHWPSDAVSGALLGIGCAVLIRWLGLRSNVYRSIRTRVIDTVQTLWVKRQGLKRTS